MKTNDIKDIINLVVIKTVSFEFFCKTISIFDKYKTLIMRKILKKNFGIQIYIMEKLIFILILKK